MTKGAVKAGKLKSDEEQTNEKVVAHFELLGDIPDLISEIFDKKITLRNTGKTKRRFDRSSVILKFNIEGKN